MVISHPSHTIRVGLADRNPLLAAGARSLLEASGRIRIVALAYTAEKLLSLVREKRPTVTVIDAHVPAMGGLEAARRLISMGTTGVVCMTGPADFEVTRHLLASGVMGAVARDCQSDQLLHAVIKAAAGVRYVDSRLAVELALRTTRHDGMNPFESLSRRELQVMILVTRGHDIATISRSLCLSRKTVSTYRYRIATKLGTRNDVELTRMAYRYGLISSDDNARVALVTHD